MQFEISENGKEVRLQMTAGDAGHLLQVLNFASSSPAARVSSAVRRTDWFEPFCVQLGLLLVSSLSAPRGGRGGVSSFVD